MFIFFIGIISHNPKITPNKLVCFICIIFLKKTNKRSWSISEKIRKHFLWCFILPATIHVIQYVSRYFFHFWDRVSWVEPHIRVYQIGNTRGESNSHRFYHFCVRQFSLFGLIFTYFFLYLFLGISFCLGQKAEKSESKGARTRSKNR